MKQPLRLPRLLLLLALLSLGSFRSVYAATSEERFDAATESGLPPGWLAGELEWVTRDGALRCDAPNYSFAFPEAVSPGEEVSAEVTLRIARRAAPGWALGGLAIRQDDQNYWHLALCEAPAENGGRHFVELGEKLNGRWLAQSEEATKLTAVKWLGGDFAWEFNRDYRLKLVLRGGGIEGSLCETDGTVRAHFAFTFDKPAVAWGVPALCATGMEVAFDQFRADVLKPHAVPERTYPAYDVPAGGKVRGAATGFFHARKIGGRDWLLDPLGREFFWIGTDHASYQGHWCEKLGHAPYGRVAQQKYGSEEAWAAATLARLRAWGFNTLAAGCSPSLRHRGLAHIEFLSLGSSFAGREWLVPKKNWTGFPDVFSENWPRFCNLAAARGCAPHRDDPWLIGYFLDNELQWFGPDWRKNGMFESAWRLPPDRSAKKAWIAFLADRKLSIADFNRLFGTSFADFGALAADTTPREFKNDESLELARGWVRLVAEKYFRTCAEAVRRHDPHHLVLGCRFAGDAPDILDIAGRYSDIVTLNTYPRIDVDRGVPASVLKMVGDFHAKAGKPVAITEWSFPALDAGLPSLHGAGMRVDTQEQRAKCFTHFQDFLFRQPFVVGSSYFMYLDEPALGISSTFPEDSNYGLVNGEDEPYPLITQAAAALHGKVYALHREGKFRPAADPAPVKIPAWLRAAKPAAGDLPASLAFSSGGLSFAFPAQRPAWRLSLEGRAVADFFPVVHRYAGDQHAWMHPRSAKIIARAANARAGSVDIEFTFDGAVAAMRYWMPVNDAGWMASQGLWVENTSQQAWTLGALYHYNAPVTEAAAARIESITPPTAYYRKDTAWVDRARDLTIGCWFPEGEPFEGLFWKDAPEGFHSDIREKIDRELQPAGRWTASPVPVFHFALHGTTPSGFHAACDALARSLSD